MSFSLVLRDETTVRAKLYVPQETDGMQYSRLLQNIVDDDTKMSPWDSGSEQARRLDGGVC
jgi:hypothetical protein